MTKFYTIENVENNITHSEGIGISKMSAIFLFLDKNSPFKTIDDIGKYNIVILEQGKFSGQEGLGFIGHIKKSRNNPEVHFALAQNNSTFNLEDDNSNVFSAKIHQGKLFINSNLAYLEQITTLPALSSALETSVLKWLDCGNTGLSSLTICKAFMPSFNHIDLNELREHHTPRDSADFKRCLFLLESIPEFKSRLYELSQLSTPWSKLVAKWDEIEDLVLKNQNKEAYVIINECNNSTVKNKM